MRERAGLIACIAGVGAIVFGIWGVAVWQSQAGWYVHLESLFSGLALVGLIATLVMQSKELALQRQEIADNRIELKRQADAQTKMEETAREQARNLVLASYLNATAAYLSVTSPYDSIGVEAGSINHVELSRMVSRMLVNLRPQFNDVFSYEGTEPRAYAKVILRIHEIIEDYRARTPADDLRPFVDRITESIREITGKVADEDARKAMAISELDKFVAQLQRLARGSSLPAAGDIDKLLKDIFDWLIKTQKRMKAQGWL